MDDRAGGDRGAAGQPERRRRGAADLDREAHDMPAAARHRDALLDERNARVRRERERIDRI